MRAQNVAVTAESPVILKVHVGLPEQAPEKPSKLERGLRGVPVRVTIVPNGNVETHDESTLLI